MGWTRRISTAAAGFAMVLGLAGAVSGSASADEPIVQPEIISGGVTHTLHWWDSTPVPIPCPSGYYIERGANQTVPRLKVRVEPPVILGPVIAKDTVPNQFGSRAVTSMDVWFSNPGFGDAEFTVEAYCVNTISKAWLVFG
jgi:hypothetical protein